MKTLLTICMFVLCIATLQAQPEWPPALRMPFSFGDGYLVPSLGTKGYVQFWKGPDGNGWAFYDVATLSDTSSVRINPSTWPHQNVNYVLDVDNNGKNDIYGGGWLYMDFGLPTQWSRPTVVLNRGNADIDGNGIEEFAGDNSLVVFDDSVRSNYTKKIERIGPLPLGYEIIFHLGTLSGKPRFLRYYVVKMSPNSIVRMSLETMDPATLHPDSTARMQVIGYSDVFNPPTGYPPTRIFKFDDVWFMDSPTNKLWAVTADSIYLVDRDKEFWGVYSHYGQFKGTTSGPGFVIDCNRTGVIANDLYNRYVRYQTDKNKIWVEDIATFNLFPGLDTIPRSIAKYALLGDIDGDGLEDIYAASENLTDYSFLFLTTGRLASSVQAGGSHQPPMQARRVSGGWEIPALPTDNSATRAFVYNVRGELVAAPEVVALSPTKNLIREVALPIGWHVAVIGQTVYSLSPM